MMPESTPISDEAEEAHSEVLKNIESKTGIYIPRCRVFAANMPQNGQTLLGSDIILVNSGIAEFDENSLQYRILRMCGGKRLTPRDLFNSVLYHEYGHKHFYQCYRGGVAIAIRELNMDDPSKILTSFSEGFAYFFEEILAETEQSGNIDGVLFQENCIYSIASDFCELLKKMRKLWEEWTD